MCSARIFYIIPHLPFCNISLPEFPAVIFGIDYPLINFKQTKNRTNNCIFFTLNCSALLKMCDINQIKLKIRYKQ